MSDDLEARLLAEAGGAQHTLGRLLREAASTITRLQGELRGLTDREFTDHDGEPTLTSNAAYQEILHWRDRAQIAEAELTRLRAEVETVLAGGREDRETIDALEAEAKIAGRMIYDEKAARLTAEARVGVLSEAVRWALGEGDDFPTREPGAPAYWWRTELHRRASAALAETKPVEHAKALGVGE